jgi:NADPH:quinone reductase-like Zn-dependent oxidoreductase
MLYGSDSAERQEMRGAIEAAATRGGLRPVIQSRIPLAEAAKAHVEVIERRSHGKIILLTGAT